MHFLRTKKVDNKSAPPIDMADFDAQPDIIKNDIHLIRYGLLLPLPSLDSLTKHYGFRFQDRGCLTSDTTDKLAEIYNNQIIEFLSKRNGKDWYKRFVVIADSLQEKSYKNNRP